MPGTYEGKLAVKGENDGDDFDGEDFKLFVEELIIERNGSLSFHFHAKNDATGNWKVSGRLPSPGMGSCPVRINFYEKGEIGEAQWVTFYEVAEIHNGCRVQAQIHITPEAIYSLSGDLDRRA